jgi:hypothetical protein
LLLPAPGVDAFVMVSRYGEVTLLGSVDIKPRTDQRRLQFRKFGRVTWGIVNVEPDDVSLLEELPPEDLLFYNNLYPSGIFVFKEEGRILLNTTLSVLRMVDFGSTLSVHDTSYFGNILSVESRALIYPLDPEAPVDFPKLDVDETFGRVYLGGTLSVKEGTYFWGGSAVSIYGNKDPPCSACMGSSVSLGNFVRFGSTLSVRSFLRIGAYLSVKSYTRLGSGLSLFGCARFASSYSVFDSVSFASGLSVKSFLRFGSSMSLYEKMRLRSTLSVLDTVCLGSLLSLRSFSRIGSSLSIYGFAKLGSSLSALDSVCISSGCSLRSYARPAS